MVNCILRPFRSHLRIANGKKIEGKRRLFEAIFRVFNIKDSFLFELFVILIVIVVPNHEG